MAAISQYRLTNVLGTMYSEGNVVFTPDATTVIAPVGNKVTLYDLKNQKSRTLCFDSTHSYSLLSISPDGSILIALNEIGVAHFINLSLGSLIRSIRFGKCGCIAFAPNGKYFAVGGEKTVFIYKVLSDECIGSKKPPMVRVFKDIPGLVTSISWSWDSKLLVAGSKESPMASVFSLEKFSNFRNSCFTSHTEGLVGLCFDDFDYNIYTVCKNGLLCKWECSTEPEEWSLLNEIKSEESEVISKKKKMHDSNEEGEIEKKELTKFCISHKIDLFKTRNEGGKRSFKNRVVVTGADFSDKREFGVIGCDDGVFLLVGLPSGEVIQELRITEHEVTTVSFAPKGEWVAIGAGKVGQLLVYDWQAEDYVLKEQGHLDTIQCLDFSTDGSWIVTGAQDGKVKLWKTRNSFSFHTFSAHTAIVTGVLFMQNNRAVISSSLDGTVRAFDVKRDRNFRTFTSPIPTQFCGVTIDSSSTYVAAGSVDSFNVYIWHLTSGRFLLEVSGHTAPISSICFSPKQGSSMLATVSWDKTLRIRDCIETESNTQVVTLEAEGTALAFRPDGKEIAVSTLNGGLTFFDPDEQKPLGSINCAHHMAARRLDSDGLRVNKNLEDLSFNAVAYSADGSWLLAGGKSVNLCMYNAEHQVIARKLMLTRNRSLDGPSLGWTQKRSHEFGLIDMLEERGKADELKLPGTKATSVNRSYKDIVRVYALKFSPSGQMWATATTEGVMLYTADLTRTFNPIGANTMISPKTIVETLHKGHFDVALHMALRLNIPTTTTMVLERIPYENYEAIARSMAPQQVKECLQHLAGILDESNHIEFHMMFMKFLLQFHTHELIEDLEFMRPVMNSVKKAINARVRDQAEVSEQNRYLIEVADVIDNQMVEEAYYLQLAQEAEARMTGVVIKEEPMSSDLDEDSSDD